MDTRSKTSSSSTSPSSSGQRSDEKKDKPLPPRTEDLSVLKTTSARMEVSIAQYMSKGPTVDARTFKRSTMANPELLGLLNRPSPPPTPKPESGGE